MVLILMPIVIILSCYGSKPALVSAQIVNNGQSPQLMRTGISIGFSRMADSVSH